MLPDTERKLLQILWNRNRFAETKISIKQLSIKSQRSLHIVKRGLNFLAESDYIEWNENANTVKVLNKPSLLLRRY